MIDEEGTLWLIAFLAACTLVGFIVYTVTHAPDATMECAKMGGKWQPEVYDAKGFKIDGYCSK